jgi:hypothetical protein
MGADHRQCDKTPILTCSSSAGSMSSFTTMTCFAILAALWMFDAVGDKRRIDVEDAGDAGAVQEDVQGDGGFVAPRTSRCSRCKNPVACLRASHEDRIATLRNARDLHGSDASERPFGLVGRRVVADGLLDDDLRARRNLEIDHLATHLEFCSQERRAQRRRRPRVRGRRRSQRFELRRQPGAARRS